MNVFSTVLVLIPSCFLAVSGLDGASNLKLLDHDTHSTFQHFISATKGNFSALTIPGNEHKKFDYGNFTNSENVRLQQHTQSMPLELCNYERKAQLVSNSSSPQHLSGLAVDTSTFYVLADSPYYEEDAVRLLEQMKSIPNDADFVVHLGDIRSAASGASCDQAEYTSVYNILIQAPRPVFLLLGDNEWNDCPNSAEGWSFWKQSFLYLYNQWGNNFKVQTMPGKTENFVFTWKGTLFIGIDMPGSAPVSVSAFTTQLTAEAYWAIDQIVSYKTQMNAQGYIGQVVIFAHADPTNYHVPFFAPLKSFIQNNLDNELPLLYMNGDGHYWKYEPNFQGQSSFLRIMVTGETAEIPVKMTIDGFRTQMDPPQEVFRYQRQY